MLINTIFTSLKIYIFPSEDDNVFAVRKSNKAFSDFLLAHFRAKQYSLITKHHRKTIYLFVFKDRFYLAENNFPCFI